MYLDEEGRVVHGTVRYEPKSFRQWHPDGEGQRIWNLAGVRCVLYKLPSLKNCREVVVVEGERDVETLESFGIVATTNAMGAGKWRPEYTQQLKAAGVEKVVIIPDNDEPGRKHAKQVLKSCIAAGLSGIIVELQVPEHGDASDWFSSGRTREDFCNLLDEAWKKEARFCRLSAFTLCSSPISADGARYRLCGEHLRQLTEGKLTPTPEWEPKRRITLNDEQEERRRRNESQVKAEWAALRDEAQSGAVEAILEDLDAGKFPTIVSLFSRITDDSWLQGRLHPHRHKLVKPVVKFILSKTMDVAELDACMTTMSTIFPEVARATIREEFKEVRASRVKAEQERKKRERTEAERAEITKLRADAAPLLDAPDPMAKVREELRRLGWGGSTARLELLFLAWLSRVLRKEPGTLAPHTQSNGSPQTGKSYGNDLVMSLHPDEVVLRYVATSPKAIIFDPRSIEHKVIFYVQANSLPGASGISKGGISDEASAVAAYFLTLMQDGTATYTITEKDKATNAMVAVERVKPGPAVVITTTVKRIAGEEMDSRCFPIDFPEDTGQKREALKKQAEMHRTRHANRQVLEKARPEFHAFQRYVQAMAPVDVFIPFMDALAHLLALDDRVLRDSQMLYSWIKAHAILCQGHRTRDAQGYIVAELADYEAVLRLMNEENRYAAAKTGMRLADRELVEAIEDLLKETKQKAVTQKMIADRLEIGQPTVSKRMKRALQQGWVVDILDDPTLPREPRERARRFHQNEPRYSLGEVPEPCGLPTVADVRRWKEGQVVSRDPVPVRRDPVPVS
jgi:hypothetical protein